MKKRTKIDGVVMEIDDGDKSTDDIVELFGELNEEADQERLQFLKRHAASYGYKIVKKDGSEI